MSDSDSNQGWTLDTLKALMDERDKRYAEVAEAKERAVTAALAAAEKAVLIAEKNAEKWRDNANEWRDAMNDRERNFLSKSMGSVIGGLSIMSLIILILKEVIPRI